MALPLNLPIDQLQTRWKSEIDPVLSNLLVQGRIINESLAAGDNTINHGLGRKLIGWIVVGKSATADIYDKQSTNPSPQLSLVLSTPAPVTVSLWVF
jgi:hypothetical protein